MSQPILSNILSLYTSSLSRSADLVKIRDPGQVEKILKILVEQGPASLQVISDFDYTITRYHKDGVKCNSCHGILDQSELMPEEYKKEADVLYKKYYPIEICNDMSIEEKIPHMVEWYELAHKNQARFKIDKSLIRKMVRQSRALFRDEAQEMLTLLDKAGVPVLIFSGGIGDLLNEVLIAHEASFANIKVVSNQIDFDADEKMIGFKPPLIHMYNKNESVLQGSDYFDKVSHRNTAILLGDSLGDCDMAKGMDNPQAVLKIGFLNDKINDRLESFVAKFDIVLIDDQSMNFVIHLLNAILKT